MFKQGLKCIKGNIIQDKLSNSCLGTRSFYTTTNVLLAELLINQCPRSFLDFLFPDINEKVERSLMKQKENNQNNKTLRIYAPGDKICQKLQII